MSSSDINFSSRYAAELRYAIAAADAAGALLREYFYRGEASDADTKADREIHSILSAAFPDFGYLSEELGDVSHARDTQQHLWLVDPQDGTKAAAKGFRGAAVSIALLREGHPVLGIVYAYAAPDSDGDLFYWAEGTSVYRNHRPVLRTWPQEASNNCTALISQHADNAAEANARVLYPMRYRAVASIAYRLALVAADDGDLAISLNGPTGWDVAGGHALVLGAGGDVFNGHGEAIRYDSSGQPRCPVSVCFGGTRDLAARYFDGSWHDVLMAPSERASAKLCFLSPGELIEDPGPLSRAQGCLLGQLAGDALGSLVEFSAPERIRARYADGPSHLEDGGCWSTIAGQPTDDSELALSLGRCIIECGGYREEEAAQAYARWVRSHPFDCGNTIGTALSQAALALSAGKPAAAAAKSAANQSSQANGALMRVSPLGIFGAPLSAEAVMDFARQDARLTHPHETCQHVNAVFAAALAFAIQSGAGAKSTYMRVVELAEDTRVSKPVMEALLAASSSPPRDFQTKMGWVLIALQNAFYRLLHARSLEEAIVDTVRCGGDADTNAAIAGALLGAVHGRAQVPRQWVDRLLSCRPISGLEDVRKPRPAQFWPVDAFVVAEKLLLAASREAEA